MQGLASPSPTGICTESSGWGGGSPADTWENCLQCQRKGPVVRPWAVTWGQREGWLLHGEWTVGAQGWPWDL